MNIHEKTREILVQHDELPISCPTKSMTLWNAHPRVYLPLSEENPHVVCPYCDTAFVLEGE